MSLNHKARWYVYQLTDPRDGAVFYVGKGTGNRIHQHEKEAAKPAAVCSKKINKIKDIQANGLNVAKSYVAFFWDEQAAYDHETDLIEEIGLHRLTNVLPGGQKAWERRQVERQSRRKQQSVLDVLNGRHVQPLLARFAEWFRAKGHLGQKFKITCSDPALRVNAMLSEAMYNSMMPMLWGHIRSDQAALARFSERIKPYGIEFA